jgi:hypothetical protein
MAAIRGNIDENLSKIIDEMLNDYNKANPDTPKTRSKLFSQVIAAWFNDSTDPAAIKRLFQPSPLQADKGMPEADRYNPLGSTPLKSDEVSKEIAPSLDANDRYTAEIGRLKAIIEAREETIARLDGYIRWYQEVIDKVVTPMVGNNDRC